MTRLLSTLLSPADPIRVEQGGPVGAASLAGNDLSAEGTLEAVRANFGNEVALAGVLRAAAHAAFPARAELLCAIDAAWGARRVVRAGGSL